MKKLSILLSFIIIFFIFFSFFIDPGFMQKEIKVPKIPENPETLTTDQTFESFTDPELNNLADSLRNSYNKSDKEFQIRAWSVFVAKYDSEEEVIRDFLKLKNKDFKAYIRQELNDQETCFLLFVGPNKSIKKIERIRNQISSLLGVSGKVVSYEQ